MIYSKSVRKLNLRSYQVCITCLPVFFTVTIDSTLSVFKISTRFKQCNLRMLGS